LNTGAEPLRISKSMRVDECISYIMTTLAKFLFTSDPYFTLPELFTHYYSREISGRSEEKSMGLGLEFRVFVQISVSQNSKSD
jgi:hypothetical protein